MALSVVRARRGGRARACVVDVVVVVIVVVIVVDVVIGVVVVVVVVFVVGGVAGRASTTTRRLSSGHQDGLELQRLPGVAPRRVVAQDVLPPVSKVRPRVRSGVVVRSVSPPLGRSVGIQPVHVDVLTQHAPRGVHHVDRVSWHGCVVDEGVGSGPSHGSRHGTSDRIRHRFVGTQHNECLKRRWGEPQQAPQVERPVAHGSHVRASQQVSNVVSLVRAEEAP